MLRALQKPWPISAAIPRPQTIRFHAVTTHLTVRHIFKLSLALGLVCIRIPFTAVAATLLSQQESRLNRRERAI